MIVAPWGQSRPENVPDGQTLWMVSVIIFDDNSTIVGPPQAVHELSAADMTAIGSLTALAARVAINDAKRAAALWARDRGDGAQTIPDIAVPSSIARDSELSELLEGAAFEDGLLSLARHDGNNPIAIPHLPRWRKRWTDSEGGFPVRWRGRRTMLAPAAARERPTASHRSRSGLSGGNCKSPPGLAAAPATPM